MASPRIVVGLDGSEPSAAALRWAAGRAAEVGSALRVLHVYEAGSGRHLRSRAVRATSESHARARATTWVTAALGGGAKTAPIVLEVVEGNPNRVLSWLSRRADVLVLGAPQGRAVRRILGGSVARTCSSRAGCPVVLVPADPESYDVNVEPASSTTPGAGS